ncbi:hypothetical protein [Pontivivens insulae]|uniref:Uncharacterized protein n=1 Tax=Pontivivens insulae TaxID=1639689 RepID=A0A2R8A6G3_9RHOB|nr:hypothetical protein [Pontivivens insulae]RED17896.1 hypothetical protein DFR53_0083 [Pontivivens insulae]SPF27786.1 hypothetical protein POI8812_00080 [Pontivivens insulae]
MSALQFRFHPIFAALFLGIASAPLALSLLENDNAVAAERQAHVELQTFQFKRVQAAMAVVESENRPGSAPRVAQIADPMAPGYRWLLTGDVPSAPSMLMMFEPDPVQVAFTGPIAPMGTTALTE